MVRETRPFKVGPFKAGTVLILTCVGVAIVVVPWLYLGAQDLSDRLDPPLQVITIWGQVVFAAIGLLFAMYLPSLLRQSGWPRIASLLGPLGWCIVGEGMAVIALRLVYAESLDPLFCGLTLGGLAMIYGARRSSKGLVAPT